MTLNLWVGLVDLKTFNVLLLDPARVPKEWSLSLPSKAGPLNVHKKTMEVETIAWPQKVIHPLGKQVHSQQRYIHTAKAKASHWLGPRWHSFTRLLQTVVPLLVYVSTGRIPWGTAFWIGDPSSAWHLTYTWGVVVGKWRQLYWTIKKFKFKN